MVLRTATKDENVPRPRTFIIVDARERGRALWRTFSPRAKHRSHSNRAPFSNLWWSWHCWLFLFRFTCPDAFADIRPIFQFSRPAFFRRSLSWGLLRANSCVRQLRVFCFPGSSRTAQVPPIKHPLALGAAAVALTVVSQS